MRSTRHISRIFSKPSVSLLINRYNRRVKSLHNNPLFFPVQPVSIGQHHDCRCRRRRSANASPHRRSGPSRWPPERAETLASRRQDRADQSIVRLRFPIDRGNEFREPEMGAADGRQCRGIARHPAQARRLVSGADAQHKGLRECGRPPPPHRNRIVKIH